MYFNFLRTGDAVPSSIILISTLVSFLLKSMIQPLHGFAYILLAYIYLKALKEPWLLLLTAIALLFIIEPTPKSIGIKEAILILTLSFYILFHWLYELSDKEYRWTLKVSLIFVLLVGLSGLIAGVKQVPLTGWLRGIAPFLILYLAFPLAITLNKNFQFKLRWLFIAFVVLALELISHILFVFFLEGFNHFYWLDPNDKTQHLGLSQLSEIKHYLGPYRDRITMRIQQATSEVLPISFTLFTLLSFMARKNVIKNLALLGAVLALVAILATLTRSMLTSALLVLSVWLIFFTKEKLNYYLKNILILIVLGLAFTTLTDINTIWIGRFGNFFKEIIHLKNKPAHTFDSAIALKEKKHQINLDQNLLSRLEEYKIALSMFAANPLVGAGIGAKHAIAFQGVDNRFIKQKVGYVHNWFFYWLMVGGILGLLLYSALLFTPIMIFAKLKKYTCLRDLLVSNCAVMTTYALFFAVFRLISFNFILALMLGIAIKLWRYDRPINDDYY